MAYEPQSTSSLFRVPIEIRRAIYTDLFDITGVHIAVSSEGRVRLSCCLDPDLGAENIENKRRSSSDDDDPSGKIGYPHQVPSGWGPHVECEEIALAKGFEGDNGCEAVPRDSFLTICKRL
ncbi:hypothetical protein PG994_004879 [Apiospora phragmitis]|uniref:DUF7730 domain-containing protein n=1 Tax=Apiospora phragmitis TaxID=2905665 RepID=A0ABR1VRU5_9PEZI